MFSSTSMNILENPCPNPTPIVYWCLLCAIEPPRPSARLRHAPPPPLLSLLTAQWLRGPVLNRTVPMVGSLCAGPTSRFLDVIEVLRGGVQRRIGAKVDPKSL